MVSRLKGGVWCVAVQVAFAFSCVLVITTAGAARLESIDVSNKAKVYKVRATATLAAPIEPVYDTLIEFDDYEKFSSVYHDARWLTRNEDDSGEIYTYTRGCILFFCKGFRRHETVETVRLESIITRVVPENSDVKYGYSKWQLTSGEATTTLEFSLDFEPDFWVPPVIGPYVVKRMLRKGSRDALDRIEVLANQRVENTTQ